MDVQPFWRAVIDTALTPRGIMGLLRSGLGTIKGALVMPLMQARRPVGSQGGERALAGRSCRLAPHSAGSVHGAVNAAHGGAPYLRHLPKHLAKHLL